MATDVEKDEGLRVADEGARVEAVLPWRGGRERRGRSKEINILLACARFIY